MHNLSEHYVVKSDPKIMSNALLTCNDNTGSNNGVNILFLIFLFVYFSYILEPLKGNILNGICHLEPQFACTIF